MRRETYNFLDETTKLDKNTHVPVITTVRAFGSTSKSPKELFLTVSNNSLMPFVFLSVNINSISATTLPFLK